jgi:hypothetical protein
MDALMRLGRDFDPAAADVVDQDVDGAVVVQGSPTARAASAGWPTVRLERERPRAAVPDLGGRALPLGLLPID